MLSYPKPVSDRSVPVWFGGESNPALRRVAEYGDGWIGFNLLPDQAAEKIKRIEELLKANGRNRSDVKLAVSPYTNPIKTDDLNRYRDAGVEEIALLASGRPRTERDTIAGLERDRGFEDSPLEGAVTSEPVSESEDPGVKFCLDLGRVLDDSGIVKRWFALIISRKIVPLSLAAGPRYPGLSRCYRVCFAGWAWRRAGEFTVYKRSWLDHTNLNVALKLMFFSHLRVQSV